MEPNLMLEVPLTLYEFKENIRKKKTIRFQENSNWGPSGAKTDSEPLELPEAPSFKLRMQMKNVNDLSLLTIRINSWA